MKHILGIYPIKRCCNSNGLSSDESIKIGVFRLVKLITLIVSFFVISNVYAIQIFIQDGSTTPNPDGTVLAPFETIQSAISHVETLTPVPSDVTFQIMSGTYDENIRLQIDDDLTQVDL